MKMTEEAMVVGADYCGPEKTSHKGFCQATLENFMKDCPWGSYLAMKSTPRVPGGIPLLYIGYKYSYRMVLWFIDTDGYGSTESGDPYLSCFTEIYSNVSVHPIVCPHLIGRYFNACNKIDNKNGMHQSYLVIEKYCVTQSGHFRLTTTVALGMGITYGKLLYCHGVAERNVDNKIWSLNYNNRTVLTALNNPFTDEFGSPALNISPITFDDRNHPHKIDHYTPYLLPSTTSVASVNYFSTLITPSDLPDILPSYYHNTLHVMKKYVTFLGRPKRGYCCMKYDIKRCYKKTRFYFSKCSDNNKEVYYCHGFSRINS